MKLALLIAAIASSAAAQSPAPAIGPLSCAARLIGTNQVQVYCYRNTAWAGFNAPQPAPVWLLVQNTISTIDAETASAVVHYSDPASGCQVTWIIWRRRNDTKITWQYAANTSPPSNGAVHEGQF